MKGWTATLSINIIFFSYKMLSEYVMEATSLINFNDNQFYKIRKANYSICYHVQEKSRVIYISFEID